MKKGYILRSLENPKLKFMVRRGYKYRVGVRFIKMNGELGNYETRSKNEFEVLATP